MEHYEYRDENVRGRIERFEYSYKNDQGEVRDKYALVYLPACYKAEDKDTRYNVLYLIHGGMGSQDAWFDSTFLKNMLDHMIAAGEIKPLIVVTPTYYSADKTGEMEFERSQIRVFQDELRSTLIPQLEGKYNTYLTDANEAGIAASRMHRGISGFSMGGGCTWYAFGRNLKYIGYFVPLSGDCWELEMRGGNTRPAETAEYLAGVVKESGMTSKDFYLFPATGEGDIAHPNLTPQVAEMRKYPDIFVETDDDPNGNFHYILTKDGVHCYADVCEYLHMILPKLFK